MDRGNTSISEEFSIKVYKIKVYHAHLQTENRPIAPSHKDKADINLKSGVYRIPCTCSLVCIREPERNLDIRKKERKDRCAKCKLDNSPLAKLAWDHDYH